MACSGRYASAQEFEELLCLGADLTDPVSVANLEHALELAASDIHMMLASVDACDCTHEDWAMNYLKKLNIIDAAVIQNCTCAAGMSDASRKMFLEWLERQYELIRTGQIELCQNNTGSRYPAWGVAQVGWTDWSKEQIAFNEIMRRNG